MKVANEYENACVRGRSDGGDLRHVKKVWRMVDAEARTTSVNKKEINIILNNRIFSMILHLKIISHSHHHHHLCALAIALTLSFIPKWMNEQMILSAWSYDMPSLVAILMCRVHEDDYLCTHICSGHGRQQMILNTYISTHTRFSPLIVGFYVTLYCRLSRQISLFAYNTMPPMYDDEIVSNFGIIWGIYFVWLPKQQQQSNLIWGVTYA